MPTTIALDLTLEDVAHFADGSDELPDDTATRLQALICCEDLELVQSAWRRIGEHRKALRRMAEDAGVELLVDAVFVYRILERLRAENWDRPEEVQHPGLDVLPYQQLISMAVARAERARDPEKAEMLRLKARLVAALGHQLGGERCVQHLIDRLLEVGEEDAEETLSHLLGVYRHRREAAAGRSRPADRPIAS